METPKKKIFTLRPASALIPEACTYPSVGSFLALPLLSERGEFGAACACAISKTRGSRTRLCLPQATTQIVMARLTRRRPALPRATALCQVPPRHHLHNHPHSRWCEARLSQVAVELLAKRRSAHRCGHDVLPADRHCQSVPLSDTAREHTEVRRTTGGTSSPASPSQSKSTAGDVDVHGVGLLEGVDA